jgi:hypothetical protein
MGARYRLPEVLGGGEVEAARFRTELPGHTAVDVPGVGTVILHTGVLTELTPPLPPEPTSGVVRCDAGYIHIKQGPSWTGHNGVFTTWVSIHRDCEGAVLLVPDPLAEAPELPWSGIAGSNDRFTVGRNGRWVAFTYDGPVKAGISPELARQMGLALLKAAAGQEAGGNG